MGFQFCRGKVTLPISIHLFILSNVKTLVILCFLIFTLNTSIMEIGLQRQRVQFFIAFVWNNFSPYYLPTFCFFILLKFYLPSRWDFWDHSMITHDSQREIFSTLLDNEARFVVKVVSKSSNLNFSCVTQVDTHLILYF